MTVIGTAAPAFDDSDVVCIRSGSGSGPARSLMQRYKSIVDAMEESERIVHQSIEVHRDTGTNPTFYHHQKSPTISTQQQRDPSRRMLDTTGGEHSVSGTAFAMRPVLLTDFFDVQALPTTPDFCDLVACFASNIPSRMRFSVQADIECDHSIIRSHSRIDTALCRLP